MITTFHFCNSHAWLKDANTQNHENLELKTFFQQSNGLLISRRKILKVSKRIQICMCIIEIIWMSIPHSFHDCFHICMIFYIQSFCRTNYFANKSMYVFCTDYAFISCTNFKVILFFMGTTSFRAEQRMKINGLSEIAMDSFIWPKFAINTDSIQNY